MTTELSPSVQEAIRAVVQAVILEASFPAPIANRHVAGLVQEMGSDAVR